MIALLANSPIQDESLLHSREQAAGGIGLYVNTNKMEYMCFNQKGDISTFNSCSQKLAGKFTYPGSSVSSYKIDINVHWHSRHGQLLIGYRSYGNQTYSIKNAIFPSCGRVYSTISIHHFDAGKAYWEKARQELHRNVMSYIKKNPGNNIPQSSSYKAT